MNDIRTKAVPLDPRLLFTRQSDCLIRTRRVTYGTRYLGTSHLRRSLVPSRSRKVVDASDLRVLYQQHHLPTNLTTTLPTPTT